METFVTVLLERADGCATAALNQYFRPVVATQTNELPMVQDRVLAE